MIINFIEPARGAELLLTMDNEEGITIYKTLGEAGENGDLFALFHP